MCPLRFILVFFSAILAGYCAWRTVRSSPGTDINSQDSTNENIPTKKEEFNLRMVCLFPSSFSSSSNIIICVILLMLVNWISDDSECLLGTCWHGQREILVEEDETRASQNLLANCKWFFLIISFNRGYITAKTCKSSWFIFFSFLFRREGRRSWWLCLVREKNMSYHSANVVSIFICQKRMIKFAHTFEEIEWQLIGAAKQTNSFLLNLLWQNKNIGTECRFSAHRSAHSILLV